MAELAPSKDVLGQESTGQDLLQRRKWSPTPQLRPRSNVQWILEHQIQVAVTLVMGLFTIHTLVPSARDHTRKFFRLSYPTAQNGEYIQGVDDLYFMLAWVVNFTALRAITIEWLLQPTAAYLGVVKKNQIRFAEQGWMALYYALFWTLGMYLWINSPYWNDSSALWVGWPAREMSGTFKWYYLTQLAFWVQQILVIHIEARRKDHGQMLTHHLITCTLVSVTYVYRYTRAANVVLCLMDVVDLLLPIAKILKYLNHEVACNATFVLFVVTWFIARHVLYIQLCISIYRDVPGASTMEYGCYSGKTSERIETIPSQPDYFEHLLWPFQDLDGVICLNTEVKWIFLSMLGFLQLLSMIWFGMILKVVYAIVRGGAADDIRSDDEGGDEEHEVEDGRTGKSVKKDGGAKRRNLDVTAISVCADSGSGGSLGSNVSIGGGGSRRLAQLSPPPKARPTSARRRLLDAENRKELLNRIGCDNPQ